jgi:hypothetical protein
MTACFNARSGSYHLTLYRVRGKNTVGFTWGCREGDDFAAYLDSNPNYGALADAPRAFLRAFELANPLQATGEQP